MRPRIVDERELLADVISAASLAVALAMRNVNDGHPMTGRARLELVERLLDDIVSQLRRPPPDEPTPRTQRRRHR